MIPHRGIAIIMVIGAIGAMIPTSSPSVRADSGLRQELDDLAAMLREGQISKEEYDQIRRATVARHTSAAAPAFFCSFDGKTRRMDLGVSSGYSPNANAQRVVKEILDQAGMAPSFIVRPDPRVDNAAAAVLGEERFVLYNTQFVDEMKSDTGTNWSVYSVMAHELGHHLLGHTLRPGGSRPPQEIDADEYSGFILAQLGAPLDQAQIAMRTLASEDATATHPAKAERISAIARGYRRGMAALASGRQATLTHKSTRPPATAKPDDDDEDSAGPNPTQPVSGPILKQPGFGSRCCTKQGPCPMLLPGLIGDSCFCATIFGGIFTGAACP